MTRNEPKLDWLVARNEIAIDSCIVCCFLHMETERMKGSSLIIISPNSTRPIGSFQARHVQSR